MDASAPYGGERPRPLASAVARERRTFVELPFGDLDAVVLSEVSRFTLRGLVEPLDGNGCGLRADGRRWTSLSDILRVERIGVLRGGFCPWAARFDRAFALAVGGSPRYGSIAAGLHVDRRSVEGEPAEQFSATTFRLPDGTHFLAFRGTDLSLAGWKEDFDLLFEPSVPGERDALAYLRTVAGIVEGPLRLGGHSKGGTLAEFAAVHAESAVAERLVSTHNLDGPGLRAPGLDARPPADTGRGVRKVVPAASFYGLLFADPAACRAVASGGFALQAHGPCRWRAAGGDLAPARRLSPCTAHVAARLQEWLAGVPLDERRRFVDGAYRVLAASGAESFSELPLSLVRHARDVADTRSALPREDRRLIGRLARSFIRALAAGTAGGLRASARTAMGDATGHLRKRYPARASFRRRW